MKRKQRKQGKKGVTGGSPSARRDDSASSAPRDARGRVHLALFRDPASGAEQVSLRAPVFREDWQNELVAGAASTARAATAGAPNRASAVALARGVMDAVSRLLAGLLARAPAGAVACKAGCDHCCFQAVSVTLPEALAIVEHIDATWTADDRQALRGHLAERHAATRGLSAAERFSPQHPCPLLDRRDGSCRIYEVRPLSCRGMNALDADECARRLRDPEARRAFVAGGQGGRVFREPIAAVQAVSAGLQLAL